MEPQIYDDDELEEDDLYSEDEEDESPPVKSKRTRPKLVKEDDIDEVIPKPKKRGAKKVVQPVEPEEEEEEEEDEDDDFDRELLLTDEEEWEMNTGPTKDISKMTERQRKKVLEDSQSNVDSDADGLMQLSNERSKRKVLTEEELQLKKLETARKRRNFTEKKLEEEKQDTLNKLLKKRAVKVRNLDSLNDEALSTELPRRPLLQHKLLLKYVSSKSGLSLGIPSLYPV